MTSEEDTIEESLPDLSEGDLEAFRDDEPVDRELALLAALRDEEAFLDAGRADLAFDFPLVEADADFADFRLTFLAELVLRPALRARRAPLALLFFLMISSKLDCLNELKIQFVHFQPISK